MEVLQLMLLYAVEILKYYLAYDIFFGTKVNKFKVPAIGGLGYLLFVLFYRGENVAFQGVIKYFVVLTVMLFVLEEDLFKRIVAVMTLLFVTSSLDAGFGRISSHLLPEIANNHILESLIENGLTLFIICLVYLIKNRNKNTNGKSFSDFARNAVLPLVMLIAMEMLIVVAYMSFFGRQVDDTKIRNLTDVLCILSDFSIGTLGILVVYIKHTNETMEKLVESEIMLKDMQKRYYETLLEREADTRRYRHDMKNHLLCIESLSKEGNLEAVQNYIQQMKQNVESIQKNCYVTGNDILDILTNHYTALLDQDVEVEIKGTIQISVDDMKLCTIYANLLQNAVEEIGRCKSKAFLRIQFEKGSRFSRITIENSLAEEQTQATEDGLFATKKQDKQNHGLGLRNVRQTVGAIGGSVELKKTEKSFLAIVVIPQNMTV